MKKMPDQELKARWTAALRSGEYEQGTGQLRCTDGKLCVLVMRWTFPLLADWIDENL